MPSVDSIKEDPPIAMKDSAALSKTVNNAEVDKLRNAKSDGKDWLAKLENRKNVKRPVSRTCVIKYNKVFGYYLEVTKSFKNLGAGLLHKENRRLPMQSAISYTGIKRAGRYDSWCQKISCMLLNTMLYSEVRDTIGKEVVRNPEDGLKPLQN